MLGCKRKEEIAAGPKEGEGGTKGEGEHKGRRGGGHKGGRGGGTKGEGEGAQRVTAGKVIQPAEKPPLQRNISLQPVEENSHVHQSPATTHLEPPHLPCRGVQDLRANGLCLPHSTEGKQREEHAGIEEEFYLQQRCLPGVECSEVLREGHWWIVRVVRY